MAALNPPRVALAFPPLVEASFGNYFPSTAALSGYLHAQGVPAEQHDLNEDFAVWLLARGRLAEVAALCPGLGPGFASQAALVTGLRHHLFDDVGRHRFRGTVAARALGSLAAMLRMDTAVGAIPSTISGNHGAVPVFRRFFEDHSMVHSLGPEVVIVGLSMPMGVQLLPTILLAGALKQRNPEVRVVIGGPTVSLMRPEDLGFLLLSFPCIDAAVRFDGEIPFHELVSQVLSGCWEPATTPGVSVRAAGSVLHVPAAPGPSVNALPFFHYDEYLMSRLAAPDINILQAKGCYWGRCAYCDFVELYGASKPYRGRTAENFADEVEYQIRMHGLHHISVISESIPVAFARRLSAEFLRRGMAVGWGAFAMVERHFTEEVFMEMVGGGCTGLLVGMESMTDRTLLLVEKAATRAENVRFLRAAAAAALPINVNLIPDLPSTTFDEAMESLAVFREHADLLGAVSVYPFEATRSSGVGRSPARFGLRPGVPAESAPAQAQFATNHANYHDPAMTPDQRFVVIAAYREFAEHRNAEIASKGKRSTPASARPDSPPIGTRYGMASVDIVAFMQTIWVYQPDGACLLELSEDWKLVLDQLCSARGARIADMVEMGLTEADAYYAVKVLRDAGVLQILVDDVGG